jgi:hypothetical protein
VIGSLCNDEKEAAYADLDFADRGGDCTLAAAIGANGYGALACSGAG